MSDLFEPTFNAVVEPHPSPRVDLEVPNDSWADFPPGAVKPHRQKATIDDTEREPKVECYTPDIAPAYDPLALFQALGASFAVGAITGTLITYAFSRRSVVIEA